MANRFEQQAQIAIVTWIRTVSPSTLVWHTPNGGLRSKREAALLKAMGTLAGIPDLQIIAEPPGPTVGFLEVKAPGGRLSPEQLLCKHRLEGMGVPYAVVRSIDDVRAVFRDWLIRVREVQPELPLRLSPGTPSQRAKDVTV